MKVCRQGFGYGAGGFCCSARCVRKTWIRGSSLGMPGMTARSGPDEPDGCGAGPTCERVGKRNWVRSPDFFYVIEK